MSDLLAELFSSKVRAATLTHVLARPHLRFSLTDLSRALALPISSLQHECYKLTRIGVLRDARAGASRRYAPNPAFPLLAPLRALVLKDLGIRAALGAAVEGVFGLDLVFLAGDPMGAEPTTLVVVGVLPVEALDALEERARAALAAAGARPPMLAFFPPAEWRARRASGNALVADLLGRASSSMVGSPTACTDPSS